MKGEEAEGTSSDRPWRCSRDTLPRLVVMQEGERRCIHAWHGSPCRLFGRKLAFIHLFMLQIISIELNSRILGTHLRDMQATVSTRQAWFLTLRNLPSSKKDRYSKNCKHVHCAKCSVCIISICTARLRGR